jgi:asparagine synthase (glutamine-hydrolysing)
MCGIWGYIGTVGSLANLIPVSHRGPDDFGTASFATPVGRLELANWRLRILDLSPLGHQPMSYAGGRFWVVYNGEIYNYKELRAELEAKGHRFRSECDTEVLLASYAQWGESCLRRFNGMFAFCLWDNASRKLFVARDRYGIKPLYYFNSSNGLAFASEIKQFLGLPFFEARMNAQRAFEFLAHGFLDHTRETLFRGVSQIRGGEYALIPVGYWRPGDSLPIKRWYTFQRGETYSRCFEEASEEYRSLLTDSVRLRLRSDVPVGSCLSGGMDSSAIVCIANDVLKKQGAVDLQKTFTSSFEIEEFDERSYAREVAGRTGVQAHYVFPQEAEVFPQLEQLIWNQDEPFNSTSIFAQWCLFKSARANGAIVMLDGQGGDEQLASYPQFFAPFILGLFFKLRLLQAYNETGLLRKSHGWRPSSLAQTLLSRTLPFGFYLALRKLGARATVPFWINEEWMRTAGVCPLLPWRRIKEVSATANLSELSTKLLMTTAIPMLLHWEDRNSMAWSVEARVPFLDYRLVEFALRLPDSFKIRNGVTKYVLRTATSGVVPSKVRDRLDKMGFITPEEVWMRGSLRPLFEEGIRNTCACFPALFKKAELQRAFRNVVQGGDKFSSLFWRVVTFGVWGRAFKIGD